MVFSYKPLPGAEEQIFRLISDITISMKSTDYLRMPQFVSSGYEVYLSEEETQRYVSFKRDLLLQLPDGEITAANAAALSGKLSQMANGAVYTDDGESIDIHDRKLDALEDIIESMGGKPLLVAYWFRHDLERITKRLHKLKIPFSRLDSSESIRRWNAGEDVYKRQPKYSVSLIIPKSDTVTINRIKAAIEAAYKEGEAKLKGNGRSVPALSVLKTPLRDGDAERPDDEAYANAYFVNANSATAPGIVDADRQPILDTSEVYSGVYGRASINFYAFNSNGNKGIACGLNNLQKIRDGEPLGGKSRPEDDFADEDEDFLS